MVIHSAYSILPLSGAVLVFLLGLFIWLKKIVARINVVFFLFSLTIVVWMFGTFMMFNATNDVGRVFWDRFVYIGVVFMPIILYHFGLFYCGLYPKQRALLSLGYVLAAIFLPLSQISDKFVSGLYIYQWGVHTVAHSYHNIFLFYFFFFLVAFFINLIRHFLSVSGERKDQVRYVLIGYGILYGIGPLAFLPAYGIAIHPAIFLCAIPFALFLSYAVIKHQALDIKAISAEVLVAFVNVVVISHIFFPGNATDITVRIVVAGVVLIVSLFAVRSVYGEIRQHEQLAQLDVLRKHNAQLKEFDRQKTEFLNIAAHQLRTPVSIIRSYIAMMQDGDYGAVSPEIKEVLGNIYDSNQWLVRLADEFLDISRLESGQIKYHFAPGDLAQTLRAVVGELAHKAEEKGLSINLDNIPASLPITFDEEKIKHIILNCIENAIKYTPEGSIIIKVEKVDNGAAVTVIDTGIGFTPEDVANFFQKFQRGKNAKEIEVNTSTGLGLYIVRKFGEGHSGKVWAKSAGINCGSEFGFYLPLSTTIK